MVRFRTRGCICLFKATPRNDRLTALRVACLHIFRQLAQILLEIRQYSCVGFIQADEKSDGAIHTQSLCGVALKTPLAEFTGNGAETISFSMLLSVHLGIKPKREAEKLREYLNEGKTLYFILGTERIGNYKWVITKLSQSDFRIDNKGNVIAVKVNVTLNSYEKR